MGKTPNYGPASRMGTLVWDDGLAEAAEYNARLCMYGHDACRNTGKTRSNSFSMHLNQFKFPNFIEKWYPAGQNIAKGKINE